jgi:hypothetical protein
MSEAKVTLRELFGESSKGLPQDARSAVQSNHFVVAIKSALANESKAIRWDVILDALVEKILEMLDIPILEIIVPAWKKYREIEKFADTEKYPPGDTQLVSLVEHTLKSEHRPYVEILFKGVAVGRIEFTLTVEFKLEGFVLRIQEGRIKAIDTGSLQGRGTLALDSTIMIERDFGTVRLPGKIGLGDGIELRASDNPRVTAATD